MTIHRALVEGTALIAKELQYDILMQAVGLLGIQIILQSDSLPRRSQCNGSILTLV